MVVFDHSPHGIENRRRALPLPEGDVPGAVVSGEAAVVFGNHFGSGFRKMLDRLSPDLLHRQSLRRRTGYRVPDRDGSGRWRLEFQGCEDAPEPCWCPWLKNREEPLVP